jgi:hypothetical protein
MTDKSDAAQAEQLSSRRARVLPILAVLVVGQQATYFTDDAARRPANEAHIAAWLVLSVIILIVLATGGGWIYPRRVRQLANDEATRAHRANAFRAGFFASMATCVAVYFATMFRPFSGREAIHLVMTVGLVVTLLWFAFLERRAHAGD